MGSTFYVWDTDWIDSAEEHTVPPGRDPIVADIPGDVWGKNSGFFGGPAFYAHVIAINADAVELLGPDVVLVRRNDLRRLTLPKP